MVMAGAQKMGISDELIRLIEMTMKGCKEAIITQDGVTKAFEINTGIRQEDGLPTTLFNIAMAGVMRA